jgi:peptidoglycan/LPS O-acetylase OafA/YrhL
MAERVSEIRPLTGIRGAAAIVVMVYHFHQRAPSSGPFSTALNHGYLSVDLFFILSGFVMAHVYGESVRSGAFRLGRFLGHRFARIYPLYGLVTLGFLALALLHSQGVPIAVALSNLTMLQALGNWPSLDPPAWSISVEAIAYLLFPLIAWICLRGSGRIAVLAGMVSLGAVLAMTMAASRHLIGAPISMGQLDLFYAPYTVVRCLAGFTLGQVLWRWHRGRAANLAGQSGVQIAIVVVLALLLCRTNTDFAIYLAVAALILALSTDRGVLSRLFGSGPFMLAGQLSLGVYLIHFKAFGLLAVCRNAMGEGAADVLSGAAVIGAAWLLHMAVERPARRAIRRWQDRRSARISPACAPA